MLNRWVLFCNYPKGILPLEAFRVSYQMLLAHRPYTLQFQVHTCVTAQELWGQPPRRTVLEGQRPGSLLWTEDAERVLSAATWRPFVVLSPSFSAVTDFLSKELLPGRLPVLLFFPLVSCTSRRVFSDKLPALNACLRLCF